MRFGMIGCVLMALLASIAGGALVGRFEGDGMVMTCKPDPLNAEGYVGTIERGGKQFSFKAARRGDAAMEGEFVDPDGNPFPFKAEQAAGGVVTFSSGRATFKLKAPANPLDGGGGPDNPLLQPVPKPVNPLEVDKPAVTGGLAMIVRFMEDESYKVFAVKEGGPAERAGVKVADVVVAIDGKPIKEIREPLKAIQGAPGTDVKLTLSRDGRQVEVTARREAMALPPARPLDNQPQPAGPKNAGAGFQLDFNGQNFTIKALLPGGPAERGGVKVGDVLLTVDDQPVRGAEDLAALLPGVAGTEMKLGLRRGQEPLTIAVKRESLRPPQPEPQPQPQPRPVPGADARPPQVNYYVPDFARPGNRITYYGGSAIVPGNRKILVSDQDGEWVDPTTGQRFAAEDARGSGGHGYTQTDVLAVTENGILVSARNLVATEVNINAGTLSIAPIGASFIKDTKYLENWMNPRDLAKFADAPEAGFRVFRQQFKVGERTFNALRIGYHKGDNSNSYVYDLDSGMLLHHRSSTRGAAPTLLIPGQAVNAGDLHLTFGTLVSVRPMKAPWFGTDLPPAIANVRSMRWEGANILRLPGSPEVAIGLTLEYRPTHRGRDYLFGETVMASIPIPGGPPGEPAKSASAHGSYQLTPMAISPEVLATLRAGQVIDEDPTTKIRVVVSFVGRDRQGNDVVVLTESAGPGHARYDVVYDRATGLNIAGTFSNPTLNTTIEVRLRGKE